MASDSRSRREQRDVVRLRKICLALAETSEKLSHGEPAFFVCKKMFAMVDDHHHGAADLSVWLKSDFDTQATLVESAPVRFFVPPYVGKSGWVAARLDANTDWHEVAELVAEAWSRAAPPRLTR
ncbi:MAG: MmcQ/YjbR family DNA-binding protein [Myxococcota bacterium]